MDYFVAKFFKIEKSQQRNNQIRHIPMLILKKIGFFDIENSSMNSFRCHMVNFFDIGSQSLLCYYTKTFRELMGCTPLKYRNENPKYEYEYCLIPSSKDRGAK